MRVQRHFLEDCCGSSLGRKSVMLGKKVGAEEEIPGSECRQAICVSNSHIEVPSQCNITSERLRDLAWKQGWCHVSRQTHTCRKQKTHRQSCTKLVGVAGRSLLYSVFNFCVFEIISIGKFLSITG